MLNVEFNFPSEAEIDLANPRELIDRLIAAGMLRPSAITKGALFARAAKHFDETAGIHAAFIPGRIELFGKHTDYCGGRSLLCTVDRGFCMMASRSVGDGVTVIDVAGGEAITFDLAGDQPMAAGHWAGYAKAVIRRAARNFPTANFSGVRIAFISDLPPAAGLSSSSALITGLFVLLSRVANLAETQEWRENFRTIEDLAAYCGCIENGSNFGPLIGDRGVGTFGGSQDHTAILCCRPGCVSQFRFGPVMREADIPFPPGMTIAVLLSGVIAEKTGAAMAAYNAVSLRARRLVELWNAAHNKNATYLNEIIATWTGVDELMAVLARQSDGERRSLTLRLEQFLQESTQIIPIAAEAIRIADWPRLENLTERSFQLAVTNLLNQVPETIALQQRAIAAGARAASPFGAGFGGSVWALIRDGQPFDLSGESFLTSPSIPLTVL